jgi:DNA-directed RNA polymerase specialized sigma24 family protein
MTDLDSHWPGIVAGDPAAFGRWVAGAEHPLRLRLQRFAALVDVEAVLQETLLRTWQVAPRFQADGEPNGLLRLSLRIARNLAIDLARRHHEGPLDPDDLTDTTFLAETPSAPDPFLRQALLECRDKLPDQPKRALAERLASGGAKPDQILARGLKMQTNTFLQNISRARRLLADCLRKRGIDLGMELR